MAGAAILLAAASANAAQIYDNGGPNQYGGYTADTSFPTSTQIADEFSLTAGNNTIGGIHWWGACVFGGVTCPAGNFTLYFYNDSGSNSPGTPIAAYSVGNAHQTATGSIVAGLYDEYSYSASIPDLVLTPGTQYWLGISNTTADNAWMWETTAPAGANDVWSYCTTCTSSWYSLATDATGDAAFNLTGPATKTVPEPLTLSLIGAGLAGAAALRWKKARKQT